MFIRTPAHWHDRPGLFESAVRCPSGTGSPIGQAARSGRARCLRSGRRSRCQPMPLSDRPGRSRTLVALGRKYQTRPCSGSGCCGRPGSRRRVACFRFHVPAVHEVLGADTSPQCGTSQVAVVVNLAPGKSRIVGLGAGPLILWA